MTVREAARVLDMSVWRTWRLCTVGVLPYWQVEGRIHIHPRAIEDYVRVFARPAAETAHTAA